LNHDINPGRGSDKRRGIVSDSVFNGGWRSLRAVHSGKVLDVTGGSTSAGTHLEQWTQIANHPNQQFTFQRLDDGYYRIFVRHSGKVLDIAQASMDDGAPVIQYDWKGTANQRFAIDDVGGGNFVIVAKHSGKVLDVAGASRDDGAAVTQWGRHGGPNQQWAAVGDPVRLDDN
jgi:hypothetical protein